MEERSFAPRLDEQIQPDPAVFRALADPVRRRLLERLAAGPASAGELSKRLRISRVNVSHHLSVLASAGLVELRHRQAVVRPDGLLGIRRYFDVALTAAVIATAEVSRPVAQATQR